MLYRISWVIASFGGVGRIPFAPGTWGTFVGLCVASYIHVVVMVGIAMIGLWATHNIISRVANPAHRDPSAIVIDEVTGIWLALWVCQRPLMGLDALGFFLVFRILDILKPFPINWVETRLGRSPRWAAVSVMLDDWLCGLVTGLLWRA